MRNQRLFFIFLVSALVVLSGQVRAGCLDEGIGFCQANPAACGLSTGCGSLQTDLDTCNNDLTEEGKKLTTCNKVLTEEGEKLTTCNTNLIQCNNSKIGLISQEACNSQISTATSGLIKPTDCPSTTGLISQETCNSQISTATATCNTNLTQCNNSKIGLISQQTCNEQISAGYISLDTVNKFRDCYGNKASHAECSTILTNDHLSYFSKTVCGITKATIEDVNSFIQCSKDPSDPTKCSTLNTTDAATLKTTIAETCKSNPAFCGIMDTPTDTPTPEFRDCAKVVKLPKLAFFKGKNSCKDNTTSDSSEVSMTQDASNPLLFTVSKLVKDGKDILPITLVKDSETTSPLLTEESVRLCRKVIYLPKLAFFVGSKSEGSEECKDSKEPKFYEVSMTQDEANPLLFTVSALVEDGKDIPLK